MLACLDEADDTARLACYDALAREVQQSGATGAPVDAAQPAARSPAPMAPVPAAAPESVTGEITAVGSTARGARVVTLDTGHRFVEVEPGRGRIETGITVTVVKRPRRYVMRIEGTPDIAVRLLD